MLSAVAFYSMSLSFSSQRKVLVGGEGYVLHKD
jgi:hypothetical protein